LFEKGGWGAKKKTKRNSLDASKLGVLQDRNKGKRKGALSRREQREKRPKVPRSGGPRDVHVGRERRRN